MERNIFCIMASTGAGKNLYLNDLLADERFLKKYDFSLLVYGTTRPMRPNEKEGIDYYFHTKEEFDKIPESDKIETRSYYTINDGEIFYFTKPEYFHKSKNLICITSPYQYEHYRNWCANENIKGNTYHLYIIMIETDLKNRIMRVIDKRANKDSDIYELCRRVLQEKMEYDDVAKRIPELEDPMSHNNVFIIDNNSSSNIDIKRNMDKIKTWMKSKLILK